MAAPSNNGLLRVGNLTFVPVDPTEFFAEAAPNIETAREYDVGRPTLKTYKNCTPTSVTHWAGFEQAALQWEPTINRTHMPNWSISTYAEDEESMNLQLLDGHRQIFHFCTPFSPPGQDTPEGWVTDYVLANVRSTNTAVRPDTLFFRRTRRPDGTHSKRSLFMIELKRPAIFDEVPSDDPLHLSYYGRSATPGAFIAPEVRTRVRSVVEQAFVYLRDLGLTYGAISTYRTTFFLRRSPGNHLQISDPVFSATEGTTKPTWRRALGYALDLALSEYPFPDPDPAPAPVPAPVPDAPIPATGQGTGGPSSHDSHPSHAGPHTRSQARQGRSMGTREGLQDGEAADEADDEGYRSPELKELPASAVVVDRDALIGMGAFGPCCRGIFFGEPAALKRCDLWKTPDGARQLTAEIDAYENLEELWDVAVVRFLGGGICCGLGVVATEEARPGRLPVDHFSQFAPEDLELVRAALEKIHAKGYIHGDVDPRNIVFAYDPARGRRALFIDLSCARAAQEEERVEEMEMLDV
ncbi:hypothetical protein BDK51DRAFT_27939 [Blyttiomyces helicus]|uniref:Protein kinase domain-containing protein n=1 Tax=Blyttiomyces helicus TaxID=388810 RepID=A0A4V1IQ20_9FUNG|nr:hypothetical protein BDK51DRAFT_27939 [Blyttiomyces helicus]|eukprot:RKO85027.1 hypothetical protein BDK51DRAFT_27939 [Blyttiomyces helicus]